MVTVLILASLLQAGPDDPAVKRHMRCVRYEQREAGGREGPPEYPPFTRKGTATIVAFANVIAFCDPERQQAVSALRAWIRTRHADWDQARVNVGAERFLTRLELELINHAAAPTMTSHGPIKDF